MSGVRYCTMSELWSVEQRLNSDIAVVEAEAQRAQARANKLEGDLKKNAQRVKALTDEMGDLSQDVSQHRRQLHTLEGEVTGLEAQQARDRQAIQRNEKLLGVLRKDLQVLEQDVEANRQTIDQVRQHAQAIERETALAHQRINQNEQLIGQLQTGVQRINQYLQEERARQNAEREAKSQDVAAQAQLATALQAQLDPARARFFGVYHEYMAALATLDQAAQNRQKGNLEAAVAQYQQGQVAFMKVASEADERERLFENKRAACQAALTQLQEELQLLAQTKDMQVWYPAEYAQVSQRFQALQERFTRKEFEVAGEPVEVRQSLEQMALQAMQLYQDVRLLEDKLTTTLAQHQTRKGRLRDIVRTLRKIWDQNFSHETSLLNENDPKSTLKFQTQRPGAPNVTVYLELDGVIQMSWTGYEGMKCLEDVDAFEQVMREDHQIKINLTEAPQNHPSQPNPPLGGGPSGFELSQSEAERQQQKRQR